MWEKVCHNEASQSTFKGASNHKAVTDHIIPNKSYINPGDSVPFQLGNKRDRSNMKELRRYQASRKRKEETDKFMDARKLLCSKSTINICRDEVIVERKDKLYIDTS